MCCFLCAIESLVGYGLLVSRKRHWSKIKPENCRFSFLDGAACSAVAVEEAEVEVRDGHAVHPDQPTLDRGRLKRIVLALSLSNIITCATDPNKEASCIVAI